MIDRYSRKEIKSIWEDKNKYSLWLKIELAAAEAMKKINIISCECQKLNLKQELTLKEFFK